jgi:hypothetical protein
MEMRLEFGAEVAVDAGRQPALEAKALERSDDITTARPLA